MADIHHGKVVLRIWVLIVLGFLRLTAALILYWYKCHFVTSGSLHVLLVASRDI